MEERNNVSLVALKSSCSSQSYLSNLDELETADSKCHEVVYVEDSPLVSTSSTVNGETPTITPCSSVCENEDTGSVQEVFSDVTSSFRPPVVFIQDDDNEGETTNQSSLPSIETLSRVSSSSNISCFLETIEEGSACLPANNPELSTTANSNVCVRDFTVPCLESINTLRSRFEPKYKLNLRLRKIFNRGNKSHRKNLYKFKKDLHQQLEEWENYLNEQSPNEAYIAVENVVDNEVPPRDFNYITQNVLHKDICHLFDIDYLVGCSCERICTMDSCDCPRNSGGVFAYDRNGCVRVKPGTPIYECNSRCPCGMSCRNRVLQRGRTVKVAIFRTPNGCGWGVKTMEPIERNQLVTEYVGEAITQEEAEERGKIYDSCGQTYLFDLDFNEGECLYTLDAKKYGNISHFINHSCDPNLDVYAVWVDTLDPNFPRIAFFANRKIRVGEELTFDYQMTVSEVGASGSSPRKKERIKCHCGAANCRMYLC